MRTDRCSVRTGVVGELVICEHFNNRVLPPTSPSPKPFPWLVIMMRAHGEEFTHVREGSD